jgi:signal transduction histidine kinase
MLEMPRAEILARPLARLFPPSAPVAASVAERRPLRNAHVGNLLVSLDPLPGAQGGFLLRLREAGGREAVASQLSIASRLSAIGRLTGGVAHEIKNPLNSIALRLGLLRNRVLPEVPDAEPEIDIIAAEIARLNRVVRTFLDFTRPVDLRLAGFDLAATVAGILDLVRPEAERLKIELALGAPDGPLPLRGDEALLRQAVLNVVHNALEAMPLGGTLQVALGTADGAAELCIADTGPGLPEEVIGKVFQLYFSTKEKGSGIGLAMAFRAVQLHGGSITAENRPGGGALFRIRVPMEGVSE